MQPILSPLEVREFISDKEENNRLLDGIEFSDTQIDIAMDVAVSKFDMLIPLSNNSKYTFPNKSILMYGTLTSLYEGAAALLARNTMSYSDGGLQIPVEERMQLYTALAQMYGSAFTQMSTSYKLQTNIESGWGGVSSDYSTLPIW